MKPGEENDSSCSPVSHIGSLATMAWVFLPERCWERCRLLSNSRTFDSSADYLLFVLFLASFKCQRDFPQLLCILLSHPIQLVAVQGM